MSEPDESADKPEPAKKPEKKPVENVAITMTQEDLDRRIAKATEKIEQKYKQQHEDSQKQADEAAKKKQGEFQSLYESEQARAKKLESEVLAAQVIARSKDVDVRLRDYLGEKYGDYLPSARYIKPMIEFAPDTEDAELDKRISAAAEQFVKDNPRTAKVGTPAAPVRNKATATGETAEPPPRKEPRVFSRLANSF